MLKGILFFLSFTLLGLFAEEPIRTWTSSDGRTLEARFIEQIDESIKIRLSNGRLFSVPLNRFSSIDQEYVQQLIQNRKQLISRKPDQFYLEDDDWEGYIKGGAIVLSKSGEVWVKEGQSDFIEDYENIRPPKWRYPRIGEVLMVGYQINTRQTGILDLLLTNGTVIRFQPNSEVYIKTYFQELITAEPILTLEEFDQEISPSMVKFRLDVGEMIVDTKKLDKKSSFYIESRLGVSGIRGTAFRLKVVNDAQQLEVLYGQVDTLYQKKELVPLLNKQVSEFKNEETSVISQLSEEKISEISEICTILNEKSSAAKTDYLLEKQEEANPPFVLVPDEQGIEQALRKKIRRPRGRILPIDYQRVGFMHLGYFRKDQTGFRPVDLDFLKHYPNLTHLHVASSSIKDVTGITKIPSLEFLGIQCNSADLKPLGMLKNLKRLITPKYNLPLLINNHSLRELALHTGRGGTLELITRGKVVPKLDFSLLESFPDLEKFSLNWNRVYQSKDFEVLVELKELKEIRITQSIPESLSYQTVEEIRALLPNVKVEIIEKF